MSKRCTATGLFSLLLLGCGGSTPHSEGASGGGDPAAGKEAGTAVDAGRVTFDAQATRGGRLYGMHCASCHGSGGEGMGDVPPLVGFEQGALPLAPRAGSERASRFTTVGDVAAFAVATMPPAAPGGLAAEEYWAILAFELTPELAAGLTIPR